MPPDLAGKTLAAGCKVNLSLRIIGRREDGYHLLRSVFWPLPSPADTLTVTRISENGLRFACDDPALETPKNSIVKAYEAFARATSFTPGLSIVLHKKIPYGSGLGGGSSDAAAVLLHLNEMARSDNRPGLSAEALNRLGAGLGADVPFFFSNAPSVVSGIGEIVEPLPPAAARRFSGLHLVLVCPRLHVSTAWAFAAWDKKHPSDALTNRVENDSSPLVRGLRIENDLCPVVFAQYPELEKMLGLLQRFGADAVSMSGTGASLFGLFSQADSAEKVVRFLRDKGEAVFHHIL